jgi:hypothetical protein
MPRWWPHSTPLQHSLASKQQLASLMHMGGAHTCGLSDMAGRTCLSSWRCWVHLLMVSSAAVATQRYTSRLFTGT